MPLPFGSVLVQIRSVSQGLHGRQAWGTDTINRLRVVQRLLIAVLMSRVQIACGGGWTSARKKWSRFRGVGEGEDVGRENGRWMKWFDG